MPPTDKTNAGAATPIEVEIILAAFKQPPEKALAFMKGKVDKFSNNYDEVWEEEHSGSFTVAKALQASVLNDIHEAMNAALEQGLTLKQFHQRLEQTLQTKGWWGRGWPRNDAGQSIGPDGKPFDNDENGQPIVPEGLTPPMLCSPWRLRTIYQTNMQVSMMAGRYNGMTEATRERPYWQYISVGDGRTTAICSGLSGRVYPWNDAFWDNFYPPNHWGCRSRVRSLSESEMKRKGLKESSSEGAIGTEERLVSKRTGEVKSVATITINGEKYSTGVGWSHNPARIKQYPDTNKLPATIAKPLINALVKEGTSLKDFLENKMPGNFPVGMLDEETMKAIGASTQTIFLSAESYDLHISQHPEITFDDWLKLPEILESAELIVKKDGRHLIFVKMDDRLYLIPIKRTGDGKELFMKSFYVTNEAEVRRVAKKGVIVRDTRKK